MKKFPLYGWLGILLVIVFWYLNWSLQGLRTQWGFFFLWFGYALTVDGIVAKRKGSSLIQRSVKKYFLLFLISSPAWWLFELLNVFTNNWRYMGCEYFTGMQYFLLASLSFSTVMPSVFGTAELISTFKWAKGIIVKKSFRINRSSIKKYFIAGWIILLLIIILPEYFYYMVWIALFFIIDPVNYWLGNKSLMRYAEAGDWYPFLALAAGSLICGLFWEMWNYYSYPKWIYNLPFLNFAHIFEMPVLGYIGYIPFSFELFAIYNLVTSTKAVRNEGFILEINNDQNKHG